jgi:ribonuclease P protein component
MNFEFSRVYRKGQFTAGRHLVLHYLRRSGPVNRLGVTASRKIKGSVQRNRIKRLLRESYRLLEGRLAVGYDLVLVGRETADKPEYDKISQEMTRLFQKAGLFQASPAAPGAASATSGTITGEESGE